MPAWTAPCAYEMAAYVRDTVRRYGVTTLSVTDLEEGVRRMDRIGVMLHGRLAQFGTPAELYRRPVSLEVARFLGRSRAGRPACTAFGLPARRLPVRGGDDCAPLACGPEGLAAIPDRTAPPWSARAVFTGQVTRPGWSRRTLRPGRQAYVHSGVRSLGVPELVVHTLRADMPEGTRVRVELA